MLTWPTPSMLVCFTLVRRNLPVGDARQILCPNQLIGNSNGTMEEALQSQKTPSTYMAVGAIYSTTTMGKSGRNALGPEMISRVKNTVKQPIVAIGGINRSNIQDVVRAGAGLGVRRKRYYVC